MTSTQKKLSKVRKPRVHITYDVETEGAQVKKELPFVVGVMSDLGGNANENKQALSKRKFIQIDPDNFNQVMQKVAPKIEIKVKNTLDGDDSEIPVSLSFNSMDDFTPDQLVQQVEPLKKLIDIRNQLNDLLSKADRSEDLEAILEKTLQDEDALKALSKDLGLDAKKKESK